MRRFPYDKRLFKAASLSSAALLLGAIGLPARGLTIVPTYAASIPAGQLANVQSAFAYAISQFTSQFNDAITLNITVAGGTTGLGGSSTNLQGTNTFTQIKNALNTHKTTSADNSTVANLTSDPTGGGTFWLPFAEAKALGFRTANNVATDGTFTYNDTLAYSFDPNNRAVGGAYDWIGVAEHEVGEIMGRITSLGGSIGGGPAYMPFDLMRFKGSGVRSELASDSGVYFSVDNGGTNLKNYNFPNGNGSDNQDWASGSNDSFNAFTSSGVQNDITAVDLTVMDVIGYTPAPEPTSFITCGGALVGGLLLRRRRVAALV